MRRLPANHLVYETLNGSFVLQITGHPDFGVRFGQDQVVSIFRATLAVKHKSPVVCRKRCGHPGHVRASQWRERYRRLVAAFERIFGATVFLGTDRLQERARLMHRSLFNSFREAQLWY